MLLCFIKKVFVLLLLLLLLFAVDCFPYVGLASCLSFVFMY